jgi:hypothetical protein
MKDGCLRDFEIMLDAEDIEEGYVAKMLEGADCKIVRVCDGIRKYPPIRYH